MKEKKSADEAIPWFLDLLPFDTEIKKPADEIISWSLDLLYLDIDDLSKIEKLKTQIDLYFHLILPIGNLLLPKNDQAVRFLSQPVDLQKIQDILRAQFETHLLPMIEGKKLLTTWTRPPQKETVICEIDNGILNISFLREDAADYPIESRIIENFRDALCELKSFPISYFRKCEGCGRYFFPAGKRARSARRFCTSKCNHRHADKIRREKNLETYKAKQRKIMRKRYADKKKNSQAA